MDYLTFISSLVGSLAWPVLVLAVVLLLKKPIKDLLADGRPIKSLKAGPTGVEIEWELHQAKEALESGAADTSAQPSRPTSGRGSEPPLAYRNSPAATVLETFARLEKRLNEFLGFSPEDPSNRHASVTGLIRIAVVNDILTKPEGDAFQGLTRVRNLVAHGGVDDVTEESAAEFVEIASTLWQAFDRFESSGRSWPLTEHR